MKGRTHRPTAANARLRRPVHLAVALLLAGTVVAAFAPALDAGFVSLDDGLYVTGNARVMAGLSWSGVRWAFSATDAGYWHPLTWLSYMADAHFFPSAPGWFHGVNLALHLVNSLLLLAVLARMTGTFWPSAAAAAIFAVHPLRVESVAWIAERKDVLFTCFWLLALGAYLAYARRRGAPRYLVVVALFALGLMAKPMMVTLPFALLLLDFWPLGRWRPGGTGALPPGGVSLARLLLEKVPLFVLAALASGVAYVAQQQAGAVRSLSAYPFATRLANGALSCSAYLRDSAWPESLAVIYPHPQQGVVWGQAAGAGVLIVLVSAAALRAARTRPALAVGWAWFLGTLVPVIGLVQVGLQSRADRFTYLPAIGLGLMVGWGFSGRRATWRVRGPLLAPAAGLAVLAFAAMTWRQCGYWRNDDTLLLHAIAATRENWVAHRHLALSLERRGRRDEAMAHVREIQKIKPGYLDSHAAFGFDLPGDAAATPRAGEGGEASEEARRRHAEGIAFRDQGRLAEAIAAFRLAVASSPGFATARFDLANALSRAGQHDEAVRQYFEVLDVEPRHGLALNNLAGTLKLLGRLEESVRYYRVASEILPRNAAVQANYGRALLESGAAEKALAAYRKASRLDRRIAAEMAGVGDSLRARGDTGGARRWYREALDADPENTAVRKKLAAAE